MIAITFVFAMLISMCGVAQWTATASMRACSGWLAGMMQTHTLGHTAATAARSHCSYLCTATHAQHAVATRAVATRGKCCKSLLCMLQVSFDKDLWINLFEANIRLLASDPQLGLKEKPYKQLLLTQAAYLGGLWSWR